MFYHVCFRNLGIYSTTFNMVTYFNSKSNIP